MFRSELPRLYELKDCITDPGSPDAYFQNFDQHLACSSHVKDAYLRYERLLRELDVPAWRHMKEEAAPRLSIRDRRGRGWQPLFDILNEARAYSYLKSHGCTKLNFIPRSRTQTPDLEGSIGSRRVLCEVKTIGISEQEAALRSGPLQARSLPTSITPEFLSKLRTTIAAARQQLLAFDPAQTAIHFVYVNVSFDDFFAECKEAYFKQIDDDFARAPVTGIKIVICNDYTVFFKPLKMPFADVHNLG